MARSGERQPGDVERSGSGGSRLSRGCVGVRASPCPDALRSRLWPGTPGQAGSVAPGPRGGAGWRGRHEGSGLRHVLRVPHARSVAPAPHVRPRPWRRPSRPAFPGLPRPTVWCGRPRRPGDVGSRAPRSRTPAGSAAGPRVGGHVRPSAPARSAPGRPRLPARQGDPVFCPCASARQWVSGRGARKEIHFPSIKADAF